MEPGTCRLGLLPQPLSSSTCTHARTHTHIPQQYMYAHARIHTHPSTCTHARAHTHTPQQYMYARACAHTRTPQQYVYAYTHAHTRTPQQYMYTRARTRTPQQHMYTHVRAHTHTHTHTPAVHVHTCAHTHTHTHSEVPGLCDATRRPKLGRNYLVIFAHCSLCCSRGLMAEQVSVFRRACWLACPLLGPSWPHSLVSTTSLTGPSMSFKCSSSW